MRMFRLAILDIYIIRKYLTTFFFTMILITVVAITINYFEQVDRFQDSGLPFSKIAMGFYLHFIPWINGLLWPLFALIAVIFFTSRMAKNSEIISMLSAQISYHRILRPYLIAGGFLALLLWIGNNYIIPKSNRLKYEFESEFIRAAAKTTLSGNTHFFLDPNQKIYIRNYSPEDSTGRTFRLERFNDGELVYVMKANKITWIGPPDRWRVDHYEVRKFDGLQESLTLYPNKTLDTSFQFVPDDFIRYTNQMEMMNTTDLRDFLKYEQAKGLDSGKKYQIELYRRTADPFTIIILTIIGVSVASRKVRGGMGLHLAVGIILGAIFVILSKFSTTFSTNLALHPLIGVWIPNLIFSAVAWYMVKKAQQ